MATRKTSRAKGRPQAREAVVELRGLDVWKWRALQAVSFLGFMLWVASKAWADLQVVLQAVP